MKIPHSFITATALAAVSLSGCNDADTPDRARTAAEVPVIVESLQFEPFRTRLEAVGTSRALQSVELYPATAGDVVAVYFEPGAAVGAGDVLVELDSREERLALELATVQLDNAERLYDRYQRSSSSGAVLPTVLDEAETAVASARIELERARVALDDRTIRAPFDGFVGVTEVDPGDRINTDTLVTTLDNRSSILVSFDAPETFVSTLLPGASVDLQTWTARRASAYGEIVDIGSRIDPQNRTFTVRARVDNADDRFRPGMSFRVIADIEGDSYPVINETGLQWGADGAYIWAVRNEQAARVPVEIIQRREGRVLIDGDIELGTVVVVEGIQRMRDGIDLSYENAQLASERDRAEDRQDGRSAGSD